MPLTGTDLTVNGLTFHVVDQGDPQAPAVLMLHGFPDSSNLWRHQIPAVVSAGYRVIAPDLRGFGRSSKPTKPADYAFPLLAGDVLGILVQLGVGRFHLVGHDWGAVLAWLLGAFMSQPQTPETLAAMPPAIATTLLGARVRPELQSLVAMSVGHPRSYKDASLLQREKSWYILFFQFARAEGALEHNDYHLLREWSGRHGEADQWVAHFKRDAPANLRAALNWYRVNAHPEHSIADDDAIPLIRVRTMGIWSSGDLHQTEAPMRTSDRFVDPRAGWTYEKVDLAGHWMQLDRPDRINALLLQWLQK